MSQALSQDVQAKLRRPLVESYDHDTRKTTCTASLDLWLPVGVAGTRELESAIRYDSQPSADGRGVAFNVSGLEQMASGVTGADLSTWADAHAPRKPGLIVEVSPRSEPAAPFAEEPSPPRSTVLQGSIAMNPRNAASTAETSTRPPLSRTSVPGESRPAAQSAPASTLTAQGPVRVFVHVSDPSGPPAADNVRAQLAALTIAGVPVAAPPVRLVAGTPRRTEVRCLKRADCSAARRVAAYLAQQLDVSVAVVDMSSTYEDDAGVRPGSLELWLPRSFQGAQR